VRVPRDGSQDLFTFAGRRFHRVTGAAKARPAGDGWKMPEWTTRPPKKPDARAAGRGLEASLSFVRTEERDDRRTLYRYTVSINAKDPPTGARSLDVWLYVRVTDGDGDPIGPMLEHVNLKRTEAGREGGFRISRSLEFITAPGRTLDEKATAMEPVALEWNGG
jgi:hypothetical protein